jgi:hypothetical protein
MTIHQNDLHNVQLAAVWIPRDCQLSSTLRSWPLTAILSNILPGKADPVTAGRDASTSSLVREIQVIWNNLCRWPSYTLYTNQSRGGPALLTLPAAATAYQKKELLLNNLMRVRILETMMWKDGRIILRLVCDQISEDFCVLGHDSLSPCLRW